MVKLILFISLLFASPLNMNEEAKDEGLELDPNAENSESYENVSGNFNGVDFFSEEIIQKSKVYEQKIRAKINNQQNKILLQKETEAFVYKRDINKLFEDPIILNDVSEKKSVNYSTYYIVAGSIVGIFVGLFANEYYKKKMKRRRSDDFDYNL